MTRRLTLVSTLFALLALPATALAGPCDDAGDGMPTGPVVAGLLDGDLGAPHRACGRNEVALDMGALLLVDTANFYGRLSAGGTLDASAMLTDRLELLVQFEFLRFENVITPIPATALGVGHLNLGLSGQIYRNDRWTLAVNGKTVLPTASGIYHHAWPVGLDLGLAAQTVVARGVAFHGQAGILGAAAISKGAAGPRMGGALTVGAELRPGKAFAFVLDLYGGFGYRGPLDALAVAFALRFSDGKRFGFELGGILPFAGAERANVAVDLRASIRWGEFTPHPGRPPK
jgi:hypothetical protein